MVFSTNLECARLLDEATHVLKGMSTQFKEAEAEGETKCNGTAVIHNLTGVLENIDKIARLVKPELQDKRDQMMHDLIRQHEHHKSSFWDHFKRKPFSKLSHKLEGVMVTFDLKNNTANFDCKESDMSKKDLEMILETIGKPNATVKYLKH